MPRFVVGGDQYADEEVEARDIGAAVEEHARAHAGEWSDAADIFARGVDDDHWRVFKVTTRTEVIVTVGNARPGPAVESDEG
jgi:hypothetical protein